MTEYFKYIVIAKISVSDPYHFDADPDPDPDSDTDPR